MIGSGSSYTTLIVEKGIVSQLIIYLNPLSDLLLERDKIKG
jgi:hypothetical protein